MSDCEEINEELECEVLYDSVEEVRGEDGELGVDLDDFADEEALFDSHHSSDDPDWVEGCELEAGEDVSLEDELIEEECECELSDCECECPPEAECDSQ